VTLTPLVDAVVAVHDPSRPIARAVQSLTESGLRPGEEVRITVVCHNVPAEQISEQLSHLHVPGLRFLSLDDGIHSPAGPFNAGIDAATARYVSILGSDDHLEPGALASWLKLTDDGASDAVIAPQVHAGGATVRTPPVRPLRRGVLHPLKDRLVYRTAPLGLLGRSAIDRLSLRFPAELLTGEDQSFSARLWFDGRGLRYASRAPRYVVGADAVTRVTTTPRPLRDQCAFVDQLIADPWFAARTAPERRAIAVKIVRVHVFEAARTRIETAAWSAGDHEYASALLQKLRDVAPGFERALSLADRRTVDALVDLGSVAAEIGALSRARRRFGRPSTLVTRDAAAILAVDGPLRFMAASALL
jgi:hypothetical protein